MLGPRGYGSFLADGWVFWDHMNDRFPGKNSVIHSTLTGSRQMFVLDGLAPN